MAKSKLLTALDNHKGRNIKLEKQRKTEKAARKRKSKNESQDLEDGGVLINGFNGRVNGKVKESKKVADLADEPKWETEDEDDMPEHPTLDLSHLQDSESDISGDDDVDEQDEDEDMEDGENEIGEPGSEEEEEDDDSEDDIALSDIESLASEDRGDIIPHQRLTINNTTALIAALNRIQLPYSKLPFSEHMSLTTDEPVDIPDPDDDLTRELAFYKQSLSAVKDARKKLKREGAAFSRPADYFAEMVKSDEHMGKIKQKLIDEAASKKASAEARKQRDLKKFGKQVQVAKLQERAKEKRNTMEKIDSLKRKRAGAPVTSTNEEDLFDVELDRIDSGKDRSNMRTYRDRDGNRVSKRQKKNEKFGFGGKKRFAKSNDARSTADGSGFSHRKMKGKITGAAQQRPGKSRRAKSK